MYAVRNLYTSLLVLLTQATDRELARIVRYLVRKIGSCAPGPDQRNPKREEPIAAVRSGPGQRPCGSSRQSTFLRWIREESKTRNKRSGTRGRPKTAADIRELILLTAKENAWGYGRIMGELKKLGIKPATAG